MASNSTHTETCPEGTLLSAFRPDSLLYGRWIDDHLAIAQAHRQEYEFLERVSLSITKALCRIDELLNSEAEDLMVVLKTMAECLISDTEDSRKLRLLSQLDKKFRDALTANGDFCFSMGFVPEVLSEGRSSDRLSLYRRLILLRVSLIDLALTIDKVEDVDYDYSCHVLTGKHIVAVAKQLYCEDVFCYAPRPSGRVDRTDIWHFEASDRKCLISDICVDQFYAGLSAANVNALMKCLNDVGAKIDEFNRRDSSDVVFCCEVVNGLLITRSPADANFQQRVAFDRLVDTFRPRSSQFAEKRTFGDGNPPKKVGAVQTAQPVASVAKPKFETSKPTVKNAGVPDKGKFQVKPDVTPGVQTSVESKLNSLQETKATTVESNDSSKKKKKKVKPTSDPPPIAKEKSDVPAKPVEKVPDEAVAGVTRLKSSAGQSQDCCVCGRNSHNSNKCACGERFCCSKCLSDHVAECSVAKIKNLKVKVPGVSQKPVDCVYCGKPTTNILDCVNCGSLPLCKLGCLKGHNKGCAKPQFEDLDVQAIMNVDAAGTWLCSTCDLFKPDSQKSDRRVCCDTFHCGKLFGNCIFTHVVDRHSPKTVGRWSDATPEQDIQMYDDSEAYRRQLEVINAGVEDSDDDDEELSSIGGD